jgi:hypothetical protein
MSVKAILFSLGCLVAWFLLLPLFVMGGGICLLAYAVFAELVAMLSGRPSKTFDTSAARDIVSRLCGRYAAPARNTRRLPLP